MFKFLQKNTTLNLLYKDKLLIIERLLNLFLLKPKLSIERLLLENLKSEKQPELRLYRDLEDRSLIRLTFNL